MRSFFRGVHYEAWEAEGESDGRLACWSALSSRRWMHLPPKWFHNPRGVPANFDIVTCPSLLSLPLIVFTPAEEVDSGFFFFYAIGVHRGVLDIRRGQSCWERVEGGECLKWKFRVASGDHWQFSEGNKLLRDHGEALNYTPHQNHYQKITSSTSFLDFMS